MRKLFLNASIRDKIIIITCLISFTVSLMMTVVLAFQEYYRAQQNFYKRITLEAQIISDNIGSAVLFNDRDTLAETSKSFFQDRSILSVSVFDEEGVLFFESIREERLNDNPAVLKDASSRSRGNLHLETKESITLVDKGIVVDEERVGTLQISAINYQLDSIIHNIFTTMAWNIVLSVVLASILAAFLQKLISAPILNLYKTSKLVAKTQDYSVRARQHSQDEVGSLASMFNQMLEKVEQRDEKLEKLVEQRTFELEKLAEEFKHRAFHDSLTGLPNRALLSERFDLAIEHAKRRQNKFACLLLDLDNFKTINDNKGHSYGDQLLIEVANRLKNTIRREDLVARLGGDEFVILLSDIEGTEGLYSLLEKIIEAVGKEFYVNNEVVRTGVSIGASLFPDHGSTMNSIKRKADVAMYRAKDGGKNCFYIYTPDMQEDVRYRLMIQNDLETAIQEEQLLLYFQPKIHNKAKLIKGCEVLVRWEHPKEGFLSPGEFIPYMEESSQIISLDYYVVKKACETIKRWQSSELSEISLAVNLSGRHFTNYRIVDKIKGLIDDFFINPGLLEIEITEAVLIEDPEVAQSVVSALKRLGVRLSLDDFGTGYSSLNYLRTLPIDCIKLDQSFIHSVDVNEQDKRLIKGVVSLGKGLGLELVAEGVETASQLNILESLGCDYVQGYYFLKPVSEKEFIQWYEKYTRRM
ncbi:EAL domain-containing protein [Aliikangiella sp. G2MR2-5]|uniref:EAL domain-containing protein n=1 Tax=Aliikangiella sp. G2MR2-5 TaxID=2788943 RepID=UPI0018A9C785|nr:EAL domain-containing protein [Aliikangiella sp. G2MR2-5]